MLLNTKIEIVVTNNGKNENNVSVNANMSQKFNDIITSIELDRKNYTTQFMLYVKLKHGQVSKKKLESIYTTATLNDLFECVKKQANKVK